MGGRGIVLTRSCLVCVCVCGLTACPVCRYEEAWKALRAADGVLVPGGFGDRGVEGKILAANYARTSKVPYLGVCLGMQLAVVEYARNVLGWDDANSSEFNASTTHPMVVSRCGACSLRRSAHRLASGLDR